MLDTATDLAKKLSVEMEVIIGDDLLKNNLNLIHAVGKGSVNPPLLINLTYMGKLSFINDFHPLSKALRITRKICTRSWAKYASNYQQVIFLPIGDCF